MIIYSARTHNWRFLLIPFLLLLDVEPVAAAPTSRNSCTVSQTSVAGLAMSSSRSFSEVAGAGWSKLHLYFDLTDGDTSITRLDMACTVSNDSNATAFPPTICDSVADGVCTLTRVTGWQIASPGSVKWKVTMALDDSHAYSCTVSVGAGSGGAGDLLTVERELCAD